MQQQIYASRTGETFTMLRATFSDGVEDVSVFKDGNVIYYHSSTNPGLLFDIKALP